MMIRHPYANALVAPAVTTTNAVIRANTYAPVDGTAQYRMHARTGAGTSRSRSHQGQSSSPSSSPAQNVALTPIPIATRRPDGKFVLHDASAGVSLTLLGQEPQTARVDSGVSFAGIGIGGSSPSRGVKQIPSYGRGAVVDGRVDIANPETVLRIEAKVEGYISVAEFGGSGSSQSPFLSETLAFWDIPPSSSNTSGSCTFTSFASSSFAQAHPLFSCTSHNTSSGPTASSSTASGSRPWPTPTTHTPSSQDSTPICPSFLPFRTTLPTHYVDTSPFSVLGSSSPLHSADDTHPRAALSGISQQGSNSREQSRYRFPLPPSFVDITPSIPGFRCEVVYSVSVYVTRGRIRGLDVIGNRTNVKDKGRFSMGMGFARGLGGLLGKRSFVVKTLIEYLPRSKPTRSLSYSNLFPLPDSKDRCTSTSIPATTLARPDFQRSQSYSAAQAHTRSQSYPMTAAMMRSLTTTGIPKEGNSMRRDETQPHQRSDPESPPPVHDFVPIRNVTAHLFAQKEKRSFSPVACRTSSDASKLATLPDIHATFHLPVRQLPIHSSSGIPFALRLTSSDPRVLAPFVECAPSHDGVGGTSVVVGGASAGSVYGNRGDGLPSFLPLGPASSLSSLSSSLANLSSFSHSLSTFAKNNASFTGAESAAVTTSKLGGRGRSSSVRVSLARQVEVDTKESWDTFSRRRCVFVGRDDGSVDKGKEARRPRSKSESYVNSSSSGKGKGDADGSSPRIFRSRIIGEGKLSACLREDDEDHAVDVTSSGDESDMVLGWGNNAKKDDKAGTRLAFGVRFAGPPDEISSFPQPRTVTRKTSRLKDKSASKTVNTRVPATPPPTPIAPSSGTTTPNAASSTAHSGSSAHTHAVTLTGTLRVDPWYTCSSPPHSMSLSFLSSNASATGVVGKWTPVVRCAGFNARNVNVKDYVIVSVKPVGPVGADGSEYGEMRMTVPVMLTTDGEE